MSTMTQVRSIPPVVSWMAGMAVCVSIVGIDRGMMVWGDEPVAAAAATRRELMQAGAEFLLRNRFEDGSYSRTADPGVSALCVTALLRSGRSPEEPPVRQSLTYLQNFVQPDGGIYQPGSFYQNYETCIAVGAFQAANTNGAYDPLIDNALRFVRQLQWDESEGKEMADPAYGGAGYGRHQRPDLSNTQFLIDALRSQRSPENQAAIERALVFVSRSQNLESPHNVMPFPRLNPDGGFYYTPAAGGSSQAGETANGGLRSYGSMTYAGLKSMIYAGVDRHDPRVQAAVRWIRQNFTLSENPGLGQSGLYYYYHTFAKALSAWEKTTLTDSQGNVHDWRSELIAALAARQQPDGRWINSNDRWLEGDANLVTAYALLALSYCDE